MDAKRQLSVFTRLCNSLRNRSPRNEGQIAAVQQEIDALQKVLGYSTQVRVAPKTRCRRSNGTPRAWFATKEEALAFEADARNVAYHGDVPVLCMKRGCDGWHLSKPHWPDAVEQASRRIN